MIERAIEVEPGVRLHITDTGPAAGADRPVVLLPGLGLDHESWDGSAAALAGRHRVVCIDLRGTGRSDAPTDDGAYSLARLAGDVTTVLDRLDLADVALVGHSFGGQIALLVAATNPDRLSRIALVASNGVRGSRSEAFPFGPAAGPLEAALVRAERGNRAEGRRRNVLAGFGNPAGADPALVDGLVRCQLRMPSAAAIACFHTYLRSDLSAELAAVKLPVLQILGADDPVTPVRGAAWVQARLTDGRLAVLEGCGHYPMFEAADRFGSLLAEFAASS
ncbi:MAG: alpha/beta hydrolase [Actinobacteria bacterium]|nr:alpha/beta hydrolase [Actinomycetota bacterium]